MMAQRSDSDAQFTQIDTFGFLVLASAAIRLSRNRTIRSGIKPQFSQLFGVALPIFRYRDVQVEVDPGP